jgi:hypothetical protein
MVPAVSEAAALWRRLIAELRGRRPMIAVAASKATADSIEERTLTIYVPHLAGVLLELPEVRLDLEILLSDLANRKVLALHMG